MHNKISCKVVMTHICENLGEELNSPRCAEIKAHLEECEGCKKYFESVDATIKFYKNYNVKISPDAHNRLMDYLDLNDL